MNLSLPDRSSIYSFYKMPKETQFDRVALDIRTKREEMGLTQQALGDAIGISRADVSRLEAGNTRYAIVAKLAYDFFGTPEEERVKNEDNQYQAPEDFSDALPEDQ